MCAMREYVRRISESYQDSSAKPCCVLRRASCSRGVRRCSRSEPHARYCHNPSVQMLRVPQADGNTLRSVQWSDLVYQMSVLRARCAAIPRKLMESG